MDFGSYSECCENPLYSVKEGETMFNFSKDNFDYFVEVSYRYTSVDGGKHFHSLR